MSWSHLTESQFSIDQASPSGLSRNGKPVGWDADSLRIKSLDSSLRARGLDKKAEQLKGFFS